MQKLGPKYILPLVCSSAVLAGAAVERGAVTTGSLFDEMVDMVNLTASPKPAFRTVQFSSYDHRSRLPGGPDWFANADGFEGEPIPNFEKALTAPDANGIGQYLIADGCSKRCIFRSRRYYGGRRSHTSDRWSPLGRVARSARRAPSKMS